MTLNGDPPRNLHELRLVGGGRMTPRMYEVRMPHGLQVVVAADPARATAHAFTRWGAFPNQITEITDQEVTA